jgi:hypothetical protein
MKNKNKKNSFKNNINTYLPYGDSLIKNYSKYNILKYIKNPFYQLSVIIFILMILSSAISNITYITYFILYFIIALLFIYLCGKYLPKKDKNFAVILTLIPIIPANRIYINYFDSETILIRIIPIIGNIYDLYHMFHTKKMVSDNYWLS